MQFRNPCKKCIVRPMCKVRCPARQDFWDTRANLIGNISHLSIFVSILVILLSAFYYK